MTHLQAALAYERNYGRNIRLAAILSLGFMMAVFLVVKQPVVAAYKPRGDIAVIIEPLDTRAFDPPKPREVVKPKLPIADQFGKAVDSSVGQHDWNDTAVTPRMDVVGLEPVPYYKVEVKPRVLHLEMPAYPELARLAGVEGNVVAQALVDTSGMVIDAKVMKGSGNSSLDAAALGAALRCRFTPAMQRDQKVRVWVTVPFNFKLN